MKQRLWISIALLLVGVVACDGDDDKSASGVTFFPCGVKVDPDSTEFRQCNRLKEACICGWNSCAVREDTPDGCRSGYRYDNDEFADPAVRGRCVENELVSWRIEQSGAVKDCEATRVDAGVDAASGSDSGSGTP